MLVNSIPALLMPIFPPPLLPSLLFSSLPQLVFGMVIEAEKRATVAVLYMAREREGGGERKEGKEKK